MSNSWFIAPDGSVVEVTPDQAPNFAVARGYVPASPQQVTDFQTQQKYGTPGQAAIAGAEHAASALTFGASDVGERLLGVSPEAMAGREQSNPVASASGTVLGIAAPLVATLGASSLPEGVAAGVKTAAKLTAPSLIARAGEAAASLAPKGIAAKAVQYGAEGALYRAGNVVHEAALGDFNLTAQSAAASIGLSALLGGTLGAGVGTLEKLGGKFVTGDFAGRVRSMLDDVEGHSNLNATNAMPAKVKAVLRSKGAEIGNAARDLGIIQNPLLDGPDSILSRAQGVIEKSGQAVGKLTEAADAAGAPAKTFEEIAGPAQARIGAALRKEGSTIAVADQVDSVFSRFTEAYADRPMGVADIHLLRQDLDNEIYKFGRSLDPFQKPTGGPLTRFRAHLTQEIEDGLKAGGQDVAAWKSANRAIEVGKTMEMLAESGIERSAANNAMHLTGMMGGAAGFVAHGAPGAVAIGAGAELARRRGASAVGYLARGLRNLLAEDALTGVVNHTADAIVAERAARAAADPMAALSPETKAKLLGQLRELNVANPGDNVGALSESTQARLVEEMHKLNLASAGDASAAGPGLSPEARQKLLGQLQALNLVNPSDAELAKLSPAARAKLEGQLRDLNITPQSRIGPASGNDIIAQTATAAPEAKAAIGLLAKTNQAVESRIARGVAAIATEAPRVARGEVMAGIAHIFGDDPAEARKKYDKRAEQIRTLASDPDKMSAAMDAHTSGLQEHAPQTAQALGVTMTRAVSFLASKLPPSIRPGPLEEPLPPTKSQLSVYHRYQEAVQNPLGVLRQAQAGMLTPEAIEALQTVYPPLYDKIKSEVVGYLATKPKLPYKSKLMLSMLLGKDLDGTLSPLAIARNQALFIRPPPMSKAPAQQSKALGKMNLHGRAQTGSQRALSGAQEK